MIRKFALILAAATMLGGTAAAATKKGKSDRADDNKVICKSMEENGQRLKRTRACHTAAEWRELRRQTRETIEQIQRSRSTY